MIKTRCFKKGYFLIILAIIFVQLKAQDKQYMFTTVNKNDGLSHNQVTCFLRDKKGFLWVGTSDGLNRFDGYSFKTYSHNPNDPGSLRSSEIYFLDEDHLGRIWIGASSFMEILDPATEKITHANAVFNDQLIFEPDTKWDLHCDKFGNYWFNSSFQGLFRYYIENDSLIKLLDADNVKYFDQAYRINSIAEDSKGNIWAIDNRGLIQKIENLSNKIVDSIQINAAIDNNFILFIDSDDDFWVYDANNFTGIIYINNQIRKIEHFTPESEKCPISSKAVTGCLQDEDGKVWILTDHGGINVIDKSNFRIRIIKNDPLNSRSVAENVVKASYKDKEGIIWLGTYKSGFSYYHENLYHFPHYKITVNQNDPPEINDIDNFAEDSLGNLWIGTNGGGLLYLDRKTNIYTRYKNKPRDPKSLCSDIIVGLNIDRKGNLWIGTYLGGLDRYDGNKFTHFRNDTTNPFSITDDRVWDICEDSDGLLWIATLLGGVNIMDSRTNHVIEVFRWVNDSSIRANMIFSIIEDHNKTLWFATIDGIRSYDKEKKEFGYFIHDPEDKTSISSNWTFDIFEDSRGLIWAATSSGLNLLNRETGEFQHFYKDDGLPSDRILNILEDLDSNLWVSTSNGISKIEVEYNADSQQWMCKFTNYNRFDGLQGSEFNEKSAFRTSKGEIIFGGSNGYNIFFPDQIKPKKIEPNIQFTDFSVFKKSINPGTLINNRILLNKSIAYTDHIELSYSENIFTLEFSNLDYFHPERHRYQYKLENFNSNWLEVNSENRRISYTNLDPGTYIFKVRGAYSDGTWDQNYSELTIVIKPPFWKQWWFRILITLFIILLIFGVFVIRLRTLHRQKSILQEAVEERTNELKKANQNLEERQEEITLQNEELDLHRNELQKIVDERTTDLQIALQQAKESERLKSAFLANMSHEVRTPMNAIMGFSDLIKDKDLETSERNEFIQIIQKNCNSLLVLINDILDFSTIESNQLSILKSPFNIVLTFQELYNYYVLQKKPGLSLKCNIPKQYKQLYLFHDEVRIKQVTQNLINNAMKFTDEGFVEFGFKFKDDILTIIVKDTGVGIHPQDRNKIYEPFIKAQETKTRLYSGTGLGLAICKNIIEMMGGEINCESQLGKGTTFTVTIPVEPDEKLPEQESSKVIPANFDTPGEILIAEDVPANYELIAQILRNTNIHLTWAVDGKQAIDLFRKNPEKYHLILMDIKMPAIDGTLALKEIRKINERIPIIAVTAYANESERISLLKKKFSDYIAKPIKADILIQIIGKYLGRGMT